jgi:hypothetical protein
VKTNQCPISPSTLGAGSSCTILVAFKPTTKGLVSGTLSVTDNAPGSPQTVSLTGTGTVVQLLPSPLNFGNVAVGSSVSLPVTMTNVGGSPVTITGFSITGTNRTDFGQTNNCGTSLAAGASCTATVTFTPHATGARSGNLSVKDNGGGSPQLVPLTGTGT